MNFRMKCSIFNLRQINLILGSACNFNCIYCVQKENKPRCKKVVHPKILEWLHETAYKLPSVLNPILSFCGGEPLLYQKAIEEIVSSLDDKFKYTIVSNGSYLTEEIVDFINQHNIHFSLSHDGAVSEKTREIDVLKDDGIKKLFLKIKDRSITAVHCGFNSDIHELFHSFDTLCSNTRVDVEELVTFPYMPESVTNFDLESVHKGLEKQQQEFIDCITGETPDVRNPRTPCASHFENRISRILDEEFGVTNHSENYPFPRCGAGKSEISVDLEGNVFLCKNHNKKIGTIADNYTTLYHNAETLLNQLHEENRTNKGCPSCDAFPYCQGGCPFEQASIRQHEGCEVKRVQWLGTRKFIQERLNLISPPSREGEIS